MKEEVRVLRLLTISQVAEIFGVTRVTVYRRIASGLIPAPFYVGARCPRWRESDIRAAIDRLAA